MTEPSLVLGHALLGVALLALGAAALRAAALVAPTGLARAVSAAVFTATAAVLEALGLGLLKLGGSPVALTLAALATWGAAWRLLPAPPVSLRADLAGWWQALRPGHRVALGAATGAFAAWVAWLARNPALGHDMTLYHVPEALQWVENGRPGSIVDVITGVPVANYPVTYEVLLSWGLAITGGFAWVTFLTAAVPLLLAAATWLGLRTMGVGRLATGLVVGAFAVTPAVVAYHSGGAALDPAALAWLVAAAALCAGARERPVQLVPAVLAVGLAVGTKTTAAPLSLLVLALGAWAARPALGALARPLAGAAVAAVGAGGLWYVRNTVDHGSPLWPFIDAPWGDPSPPLIASADIRFLDRPGETLDRLGSYYLDHFAAPLLLLAGALVAAAIARTRAALIAAAAAVVSVLLWMNAPFTGVSDSRGFDVGTGDATRYLLPGVAAAATAVALATRRAGAARIAGTGVLAAAVVAGLLNLAGLHFPAVPSPATPLAGAIAGAAAALAAERLGGRIPWPPRATLALAWVVLATAAGSITADGFVERHARTETRESALAAWFTDQPAWREGDAPVVSTWSLVATLAGDRLEHPLRLLPAHEACELIERRPRAEWIVIDRTESQARGLEQCAPSVPPSHEDPDYRAYAPRP